MKTWWAVVEQLQEIKNQKSPWEIAISGSKIATTITKQKPAETGPQKKVSEPTWPATDAELQRTKFCKGDLYQHLHKDSNSLMKEDLCTKELQQTPKHKKKGGTANKGIVLATEEMCS
jgi:hypothetical protein